MDTSVTLVAAAAFGLEAVVKRELSGLGYAGRVVAPGKIRFQGDPAAVCRANLWLRAADRILLEAACFPADNFDALFETTKAIDWSRWLPPDAAIHVVGRSLKSQLSSVPACQRTVKKAIVESMLHGHQIETLPETGPLFRVEVAILKDEATLTIDTTGPSLHKRGYRLESAPAPLKETLAAAMVLLSFWDPDRPLIDPFCGSGTIPIEAALIGKNIAPGMNRSFAAEAWPLVPQAAWAHARAEAADLIRPAFDERLIGTDIDERALRGARRNAERAGVADLIHFQQRPFAALSSKREFGCVITNPPYGQRIGAHDELGHLYRSMPEVLRKLPTWSHFILTAYPDFESLIERAADRRRKLYNGRIECTYFQFHGPKPGASKSDSSDAQDATVGQPVPVFGGVTAKGEEQAELFRRRLEKRARHLRRWPTRQGITCFRIYERDIPEIPLVVDRYEDHLHITEFERPHDRDLAQQADWLDLMARTASETLGMEHGKTFLKRRQRQRGSTQHEHLADRRYEIQIHEGGLQFIVNLSDYVDTGLFLDHRITRGMVRDAAAGANFLNLYAYTGAFTVYAAAGSAARTTTVDWSNTYLDWSQRNMTLNGFTGPQHRFVRSDAMSFLRRLDPSEMFDLAVVDPPTFSNSKRSEVDWEIQRDHVALLTGVLARMRPGGVIFFSTNFRRFRFAAEAVPAAEIREISKQTVPADFRNRRIHRCWRIVADS